MKNDDFSFYILILKLFIIIFFNPNIIEPNFFPAKKKLHFGSIFVEGCQKSYKEGEKPPPECFKDENLKRYLIFIVILLKAIQNFDYVFWMPSVFSA